MKNYVDERLYRKTCESDESIISERLRFDTAVQNLPHIVSPFAVFEESFSSRWVNIYICV